MHVVSFSDHNFDTLFGSTLFSKGTRRNTEKQARGSRDSGKSKSDQPNIDNTLGSLMLELKNVNAYSISLLPNDITIRSTTKIYGNAFTHLLLVLGSLTLSARCTCISRLLSNCTIIFSKVLVSSFFFLQP